MAFLEVPHSYLEEGEDQVASQEEELCSCLGEEEEGAFEHQPFPVEEVEGVRSCQKALHLGEEVVEVEVHCPYLEVGEGGRNPYQEEVGYSRVVADIAYHITV